MIERKTLQAGALVVTPVQRIDHVVGCWCQHLAKQVVVVGPVLLDDG